MKRVKPAPLQHFTGTVTSVRIGERVTVTDFMGTNDGLRATIKHLEPCIVKIDGRGTGYITNTTETS